jgi:hypothetical protein
VTAPTPSRASTRQHHLEVGQRDCTVALTPSASGEWRRSFHIIDRRRLPDSPKSSGRDVTTWVGLVLGIRFVVRVTPRARIEGEHFLTSSNHRLRSSHVGRGGHFLDVEVLDGDMKGEAAVRIAAMIREVEAEEGSTRPVRLRARGASFRTGHLGADACGE